MATTWKMDGPYLKSCNCDPGCPCDFNQHPTHGHCEGIAVMKVDTGHFGDVDLSGLCWGAAYHWPGALHEGNGDIQPFVDERASDDQRNAILQIMSGQHGGTFFQVLAVVAPNVKEPQFCAIDFESDFEARSARVRFGDLVEGATETLRGIDPPDPYRILVTIPGGMEYRNDRGEAEIALTTSLVSSADVSFEITGGHSSLAYVQHSGDEASEAFNPVVLAG